MFYSWDILLVKDKSADEKTKVVLQVEKGTVTFCEVVFPTGCNNLVYAHINDASYQVYPKNPTGQLIGSGQRIVSSDEYEIKEEPYQLQFWGWNTDDTFDHTVTVRIQVLPKKEITRYVLAELMRLTKLVRP